MTVSEICDYGSYDDAEFTGVSFGFGATTDHTPIMFAPGVLASLWGGQVRSLAEVLGVTLDEVREARLVPVVDFKGRGRKDKDAGAAAGEAAEQEPGGHEE